MKTRATTYLALGLALAILGGLGWQALHNRATTAASDRLETHTQEVLRQLCELLSGLKDVETGQRGYLLTGSPDYLEPYHEAVDQVGQKLISLRGLTRDNPNQQRRLADLEPLVQAKLAELKETIELRANQGLEPARAAVLTGRGKRLMDQIRRGVVEVNAEETRLLAQRRADKEAGLRQTFRIIVIGGSASCLLLLLVFFRLHREITARLGVEQELRQHRDQLETLVTARTRELTASETKVRHQNEALQAQAEELSQQNEELQQQGEELEQQAEELRSQAEELQAANTELNQREAMLQTILGSLRDVSEEQPLLERICQALVRLLGPPAAAGAVMERVGEQLVVQASAGAEKLQPDRWLFEQSFASLVMAQGRTAFVDDLAARPDLVTLSPGDRKFRSLLSTPLVVQGQAVGALEVFALEPRQWTQPEFRLIEWAAAQCALALETRRLQQEVRQSEELRRAVMDHSADAIYVKDRQSRWLLANPALLRIVGKPLAAVLGKTDAEIYADPAIGLALMANDARLLERGEPEMFEETAQTSAGVRLFQSIKAPRRDAEGRIIGTIGISRDITDWKQAEERIRLQNEALKSQAQELQALNLQLRESEHRFRQVVESLPQLVWTCRPDGACDYLSPQWVAYTGIPEGPQLGYGWLEQLHPEDRQRTAEHWQATAAQGYPFAIEFRIRKHDGQYRWFQTLALPWRDEAGRVLKWFGTNTDVTEIRQAREVLARSKSELERLVAERTARLQELVSELEHFSYTITHDMRAPLRAMQGFAEMMSTACSAGQEQEAAAFVGRIRTSAARMDALIRDALSYSHAVRQELLLESVEPGPLLRGMLDSYPEFQPARAHIEIQGELPPVLANEAGLTQCFSNLLGNAVKFVKPGQTPQIRIWAERRPSPAAEAGGSVTPGPEWVRIWVEDEGIGIPKSMLTRVFDMFARGHSSYEGTGIGLALVRKVVERMDGRVGVESQEGAGSRFWLEFKLGQRRG